MYTTKIVTNQINKKIKKKRKEMCAPPKMYIRREKGEHQTYRRNIKYIVGFGARSRSNANEINNGEWQIENERK